MGIEAGIAAVGLGLSFLSYREGKKQISAQSAAQSRIAEQEAEIAQIRADALRANAGVLAGAPKAHYKAAAAAKRAGEINAQRVRTEGDQVIDQRRKEHQQTQSSAKARMAASGMRPSSKSFDVFSKTMASEHRQELDWIRKTVQSQVEAVLEGASLEAALAKLGGLAAEGEIAALLIEAESAQRVADVLAQNLISGTNIQQWDIAAQLNAPNATPDTNVMNIGGSPKNLLGAA